VRALLEVNVLIALLDSDHTLHGPAMNWFTKRRAFDSRLAKITILVETFG